VRPSFTNPSFYPWAIADRQSEQAKFSFSPLGGVRAEKQEGIRKRSEKEVMLNGITQRRRTRGYIQFAVKRAQVRVDRHDADLPGARQSGHWSVPRPAGVVHPDRGESGQEQRLPVERRWLFLSPAPKEERESTSLAIPSLSAYVPGSAASGIGPCAQAAA